MIARTRVALLMFGVMVVGACDEQPTLAPSNPGGQKEGPADQPTAPGVKVALSLPSDAADEVSTLSGELDGFKDLTAAQLLAKHDPKLASSLPYDASQASGLDAIQQSSLKLDDSELAVLAQRGFVVSKHRTFPDMLYGYSTIYAADL